MFNGSGNTVSLQQQIQSHHQQQHSQLWQLQPQQQQQLQHLQTDKYLIFMM